MGGTTAPDLYGGHKDGSWGLQVEEALEAMEVGSMTSDARGQTFYLKNDKQTVLSQGVLDYQSDRKRPSKGGKDWSMATADLDWTHLDSFLARHAERTQRYIDATFDKASNSLTWYIYRI